MPNLQHLPLPRADYDLPRKKKRGFGAPPSRSYGRHGRLLTRQVDDVLTHFRGRSRPAGIDPSLVLRIRLDPHATIDEETWERSGLILLSIDENKTLVLFSSDEQLSAFRGRLSEYQHGPTRPDQKNAPHTGIFACIDEIGEVRPQDRIGRLCTKEGLQTPSDFADASQYTVDIELWDFGTNQVNQSRVSALRVFIERENGRVTDQYVGESMVLLRARATGQLIKKLLEIEYVATIDLPPAPALSVSELLQVGIQDLPQVPAPDDDAPAIAVLDTGITAGHPLMNPAIGEATSIPQSWGDASDGHGHGTMVSGLALYGDVEECIRIRSFVPTLTLYSARVLNNQCLFDDDSLITTQMRQAIEYFRTPETYDCRVFNISIGDSRLPYQGGKVSPWASILDTLARELDVVIVVSAGNVNHNADRSGPRDACLQNYPRYLLADTARIIEPATGLIVLTVGALAHSANIPPGSASNSVAFRPIAQRDGPSPFTRSGPGLGGSIKPELCEIGGNQIFDGQVQSVRNIAECSVVSMNREYVQRLFRTDTGTSYAAPKVAHIAARLLRTFPNASANLIRALLVASAQVPEPATQLLKPLGDDAVLRVCGYGRPSLELAQASDEARVVLYAESELPFDNFHIYELPIPSELIQEPGRRSISVTLAFDPPVRHTRFDYLGVKMSFRLIRGKTIEEVAEAFRTRTQDEAPVDRLSSTKFDCKMSPTPTTREGGTLQSATFPMVRSPHEDYGETYYLVVRCERKWARDEHNPQRYAVVVVVQHSAQVNLYNTLRDRVTARLRVRPRARG
jgi:hypothetical protein